MPMNLREKSLYHQIYPAKLLTDWVTTVPSLYLLWNHMLVLGLAVTFLPSIVASVITIRFVNLNSYKESSAGRYVARYMSRNMQGLRFGGLILMIGGAWYQIIWLITTGLAITLFAWFRGRMLPNRN